MSESKEEEKNPDVEEQWGDANLSLVLKEASAIWSKNISFRQTLTDWVESHSEEVCSSCLLSRPFYTNHIYL